MLASNQFQILVEAMWEPLSRLLVSSMMTGYTLRNAQYRLCLEKNLHILKNLMSHKSEAFNLGVQELLLDSVRRVQISGEREVSSKGGVKMVKTAFEDFGSSSLCSSLAISLICYQESTNFRHREICFY
ncbi:hypothetical protein BVRB_2g028840 isoform B [Beta vulgaris subsp. vulgaris]|nr:hypothetical protein BVRB_2g028840 isoform B [Beta vulgaris subsp. vulgaris]